MYHIAIVEDEADFTEQLKEYLEQYQKEHQAAFKISVFSGGADILENYQPVYDMVFLDIQMVKADGMETARQIRDMDAGVVLMFVTGMAEHAICGYEVGALDFVMKPVAYDTFSMKLTRAIKRANQKKQREILVALPDGMKKLGIRQIYYVEVQNRVLYYHTDEGEYAVRGTMQSAEQMLMPYPFVKCSHWYMVNLMHVTEVRKNVAVVGGYELEISRRNRASFLKALEEYAGGTL